MGARATAIAGAFLALPFATLFTLLTFQAEPPLGPLAPIVATPPDGPNVGGTAVVLVSLVLAVIGLVLSLRVNMQARRAGHRADTLSAAVAIAIAFFVVAFVASIVADQYPCWIGVPNCD